MPWRVVGRCFLALFGLALLPVPRADAESVPWSYQGEIVTTGPSFNLGSKVLVAKGFATYPNEQVQFADVTGVGSGSTSVTAFQMRIESALEHAPFSKDIHTFNLGFGIIDGTSGASGSVTFHGTLDGLITRVSQPSPLNFSFTQLQVGFTGLTTQSLVLGDHLYKISMAPFNFRYVEALSSNNGITSPYQDVPISVQISDVPEPSTMALAVTGLTGLGWRAWRRRKGAALPA